MGDNLDGPRVRLIAEGVEGGFANLAQGIQRGGRAAPLGHGVGVHIHEQQGLLELRAAREQRAMAVEEEALAVEDQLILSADHVHVGEGDLIGAGALRQHRQPLAGPCRDGRASR